MQKIIIVDYEAGNIHSVLKKFGGEAKVANDFNEILFADKLVLPGVGHFGKTMNYIHESGLFEILNEAVLIKKIPVFGICLGMQLMCKHSEEGDCDGFGWFDAKLKRFNHQDNFHFKTPHIGWNSVSIEQENHPLFKEIPRENEFYFVHSFYAESYSEQEILNKTNYNFNFVSALAKDHIMGVQYHPEKSHDLGKELIKNFISI